MSKPGDDRTSRAQKWIAGARRYQQRLERRPLVAFLLKSVRRFNKIDGKHLALVIALNLFVAVIPLIIIGYAFIEAFRSATAHFLDRCTTDLSRFRCQQILTLLDVMPVPDQAS